MLLFSTGLSFLTNRATSRQTEKHSRLFNVNQIKSKQRAKRKPIGRRPGKNNRPPYSKKFIFKKVNKKNNKIDFKNRNLEETQNNQNSLDSGFTTIIESGTNLNIAKEVNNRKIVPKVIDDHDYLTKARQATEREPMTFTKEAEQLSSMAITTALTMTQIDHSSQETTVKHSFMSTTPTQQIDSVKTFSTSTLESQPTTTEKKHFSFPSTINDESLATSVSSVPPESVTSVS